MTLDNKMNGIYARTCMQDSNFSRFPVEGSVENVAREETDKGQERRKVQQIGK